MPQLGVDVRAATPEDLPAIGPIAGEVHSMHLAAHPEIFRSDGPGPMSYLADHLLDPARVYLVAQVDADIVGYAGAEVRREPASALKRASAVMEVHEIGVRATHRGHGIGDRLLDALRAEAVHRGLESMTLTVYTFNTDARSFYLRRGFQPWQERLRLPLP